MLLSGESCIKAMRPLFLESPSLDISKISVRSKSTHLITCTWEWLKSEIDIAIEEYKKSRLHTGVLLYILYKRVSAISSALAFSSGRRKRRKGKKDRRGVTTAAILIVIADHVDFTATLISGGWKTVRRSMQGPWLLLGKCIYRVFLTRDSLLFFCRTSLAVDKQLMKSCNYHRNP